MPLVVALALLAALLFAVSAWLQHHQAELVHRTHAHPPGVRVLLRSLAQRLPRSRRWWAGWAVNVMGFLVQATALYFGTVALVQPLLAAQLLFTLPLATWRSRRRPTTMEWLSAAAITTGVVVFVAAYRGEALTGEADRGRILLAGFFTLVTILILVRASVWKPHQVQATMVAVAAGLALAISAALAKLTASDLLHRGVAATAVDWPGYALAGAAVTAVVLNQWAYARGSLPSAVAAVTITNPVVSYVIGVLAFAAQAPASPLRLAGVVVAGMLISAGVVGLSRSSIVTVA